MLKIVIFLCCSLAFINLDAQLYKDAKADVEDRVEDLLRRMTLEEKVAARVISRDGNNWFHVFTIDKGKKDGIQVDMNVIAGNGLVGIVSEVGESYAKVRAIIDDKSNVSAMFQDTGETCIVKGNMESIYKGYIDIEMISNTAKIKDGDEVVTSHVSDKFLQGLSVGYVKDIVSDPSSQTKTAHLIPSVNFDQLENVLVITQLKDNSEIKDIKNYD